MKIVALCKTVKWWNICIYMYIYCIYMYIYLLFFHSHYSPLWTLAWRTKPFHFFLSTTNSLHLLPLSTWRRLSTSSFHLFLGLPLLLVPSSSSVKNFWASYPPPFSPGDLTSLSFALLSILLYFLLCSSLLVLDSSDFSIPYFQYTYIYIYIYIYITTQTRVFEASSSRFCWHSLKSFFFLVYIRFPVVSNHPKRLLIATGNTFLQFWSLMVQWLCSGN